MNKPFFSLIAAFCFFLAASAEGMWDRKGENTYAFPAYRPEVAAEEIPEDHPYCGYVPCDGCYELYVHYEPCCYSTSCYYQDQVPCKRKCLRYVDKFYEVTRYRYVPQYYTVTIMQREPEYYIVEETKPCMRRVEQPVYGCVPQYYWKPVCPDACCPVE